jgi:CubicO group peptidase (beta-lactamase class C family)
VRAVQHAQKNVGLSAAVAVHGTVEFSEQLGLADVEHAVPVDPETRFGIASVTKAFTGAALLKLHEAGRIELDAPIRRWVPEFPEKPGPTITPHLLAVHRAGIRHYRDGERTPAFYAAHYDSAAQAVELFADDSLLFEPGTGYSYSSYGYNLLAAAIERASGRRFADFVRSEILDPLGLQQTRFDDVRFPVERRAERYSYYHPTDYRARDSVWLVPRWDYSYNQGGGNQPREKRFDESRDKLFEYDARQVLEDAPIEEEQFPHNLAVFTLGAVFVTMPMAPTDELTVIARNAGWPRLAVLVVLSVGVVHLVLHELEFRGHRDRTEDRTHALQVGTAVMAYAVGLVVSVALLYGFGQFDGRPPFEWVQLVIVLGFPAAAGASAGEVVL